MEAANALPIFDGKAVTTMMVQSEVNKDVRIFEREYQIDTELVEREVRPDAASPFRLIVTAVGLFFKSLKGCTYTDLC